MDEYARQEAVGFDKFKWEDDWKLIKVGDNWMYRNGVSMYSEVKTFDDHYTLYQQSKKVH